MHLPPSAAAVRVCQARISPVASVWKGCGVLIFVFCACVFGVGVWMEGKGKGEKEKGKGEYTKLSIECLACFFSYGNGVICTTPQSAIHPSIHHKLIHS